jgi:hypothetical protein
MFVSRPLEERFWEKVDRKGPDDCWEWTASKIKDGYGQICEGIPGCKMLKAHRVSWEIHNGPIPVGEGPHGTCVCHRCDNPGCVNPNHLFLGTNADNVRDMVEKGRVACKEKNGRAKLTEEKVAEIRRDYIKGSRMYGQSALGRKYGVDPTAIRRIINREKWK